MSQDKSTSSSHHSHSIPTGLPSSQQHPASMPVNSISASASTDFHRLKGGVSHLPTVEMPSLYRDLVDPRHEQLVLTLKRTLTGFRDRVDAIDRLISHFHHSETADHPTSLEYHTQLTLLMQNIEEMHSINHSQLSELQSQVSDFKSKIPVIAICSCCKLSNDPSPLVCPLKHVLCLDCAAVKYLSKDLKCICGSIWSQEQCREVHKSLRSRRPALVSSLPKRPHDPIDEVKCGECQRSVGVAALDAYICSASHSICKKCARSLSSCPLCPSV